MIFFSYDGATDRKKDAKMSEKAFGQLDGLEFLVDRFDLTDPCLEFTADTYAKNPELPLRSFKLRHSVFVA